MDYWLSSNFVFELNSKDSKLNIDINLEDVKFSEKPSRPSLGLVNEDICNKIYSCKNEIPNIKNWEKLSKILNPFEKVKTIVKEHTNNYFKLYEILKYLDNLKLLENININENLKSLHLNYENPSFVQCTRKYFTNIECCEKIDLSVKYDFITAEGTIDIKVDPNNQEQYNTKIIAEEIVNVIKYQKNNGIFILKIYDTITKPMFQLLTLLQFLYKRVIIYKPRTTRITNSEKYVLCIDFIEKNVFDTLNEFCKILEEKWSVNNFCRDFGINTDKELQEKLKKYNNFLLGNQIKSIEEVSNAQKYTFERISVIEARQNKRANEFCFNFGLLENNKNICKNHYSKSTENIKKCILCDKLYV